MKAGLVCALVAFKALLEDSTLHGKLGKIGFAATVDEEGFGLGAKALLETDYGNSAGILLTEPTGGMAPFGVVPLGETGKVLYKLRITGKMAHGFRPERGRNAAEAASKIVAALCQLPMRTHPVYGRGNYSTLEIEGGYNVTNTLKSIPSCRLLRFWLIVASTTFKWLENCRLGKRSPLFKTFFLDATSIQLINSERLGSNLDGGQLFKPYIPGHRVWVDICKKPCGTSQWQDLGRK